MNNQNKPGMRKRLNRDPRTAFYLISAAGILGYFLLSFSRGNPLYVWMVQENNPALRFKDYFVHLGMSAELGDLYRNVTWDAIGCFPPLAYCMCVSLYEGLDPASARRLTSEVVSAVRQADSARAESVEVPVPRFNSGSNYPLANYGARQITGTLYQYGVTRREIDLTFVPDEGKNLEYGIPLPE